MVYHVKFLSISRKCRSRTLFLMHSWGFDCENFRFVNAFQCWQFNQFLRSSIKFFFLISFQWKQYIKNTKKKSWFKLEFGEDYLEIIDTFCNSNRLCDRPLLVMSGHDPSHNSTMTGRGAVRDQSWVGLWLVMTGYILQGVPKKTWL